MKKVTLPERRDEEIVVTIVVVVADGCAQTKHWNSKTRLASHIGESSVVIVVVQPHCSDGFDMSGEITAVDKEDVWPSVVVVVNEGATWAHGFGQILLPEGSVVVSKVNAGLRRDVAEGDGVNLQKQ
jgi:hypothetical protein